MLAVSPTQRQKRDVDLHVACQSELEASSYASSFENAHSLRDWFGPFVLRKGHRNPGPHRRDLKETCEEQVSFDPEPIERGPGSEQCTIVGMLEASRSTPTHRDCYNILTPSYTNHSEGKAQSKLKRHALILAVLPIINPKSITVVMRALPMHPIVLGLSRPFRPLARKEVDLLGANRMRQSPRLAGSRASRTFRHGVLNV